MPARGVAEPPAAPAPAVPAQPPTPASAPASAKPLSPIARKRIAQALINEAARTKFRGALLVSVAGEPVLAQGFGKRIPGSPAGSPGDRTIDADSNFEIASIAKPFTAITILRLVEQKKLALDDLIAPLLGGAALDAPGLKEVTIRHLLSHTSGLDNDSGISRYDEASREAAIAKFAASKVLSKPGEKFAYNNAGYCMLAAIIEKVTGKDFEVFVRDEIFKPAGMSDTGFVDDPALNQDQQVQRKPGVTMFVHPWGWGYRGCGGILTTLNDLAKFDAALREGKLLSAESMELMTRPVAKADPRMGEASIGLGWFVNQATDKRARHFHTGGSYGVRATLTRIPEPGVLIVALCDDTASPQALSTLAERLVLKELPAPKR